MALAFTKCSWKRGSIAVSTLWISWTVASIWLRAPTLQSAIRAPVPAAFPALVTFSSGTSGIIPSTIACFGLIWAPKAPASVTRSTVSTPISSINSRAPA